MEESSKRKSDGPPDDGDESHHKRQTTSESRNQHAENTSSLSSSPSNMAIKILCSNKAVGQVIGRGGQTVNGIKQSSGAHIKVSSSSESFPGTHERIILVSGSVNSVLSAAHRVVAQLSKQPLAHFGSDPSSGGTSVETIITMALPATICGLVIGKGGQRIKVLREMCKCKIVMHPRDQVTQDFDERIITLAGDVPNTQLAVEKVILLLSENGPVQYEVQSTNYGRHTVQQPPRLLQQPPHPKMMPPPPAGRHPHQPRPMITSGASIPLPATAVPPKMPRQVVSSQKGSMPHDKDKDVNVEIRMAVPGTYIGVLLGKGGTSIKEMMAATGAHIKTSAKGEVLPGSTERIMTITGSLNACQRAKNAIMKKVPGAHQIPSA
jgi:RNA-binding protein Nova